MDVCFVVRRSKINIHFLCCSIKRVIQSEMEENIRIVNYIEFAKDQCGE